MKKKMKMIRLGVVILMFTYVILTICGVSEVFPTNVCPSPTLHDVIQSWVAMHRVATPVQPTDHHALAKAEERVLTEAPWSECVRQCANISTRPVFEREPQTFQRVEDRKVFVFSAYYERRSEADGPSVRVIAGGFQVQFNTIGEMFCQLWYEGRSTPASVKAQYKVIYRSIAHGDMWTAHFLICGLPESVDDIPVAVSITPVPCAAPLNKLMILNREEPKPTPTFGVCLSAIYGRYKDWVGIVEMFEMYTLLGASEIVIYNLSLSHDTDLAMKAYIRDPNKHVTAVQWQLPREMGKTSTFFQRGALNDCLYRLSQRHQFVAVQDIDEVIVPRTVLTWRELYEQIYDPKRAIYMFQHSYFRRNTSSDDPYMITQSSFWTTKEVMPPGKIRCKSMYNARLARSIDVHFHYDLVPGTLEYMVPPDIAKLHHYRISAMETFRKNPDIEFIEDRYLEQFKPQLKQNLRMSVDNIKTIIKTS